MKVKLLFREQERIPLLQVVSSLLYDVELLYDFCLIIGAEEYSEYKFSQGFWYRKGRHIKDIHKLRVVRIMKESPLSVELLIADAIGTLTALWLFIQAVEKIYNLKANRKKTDLEIEKTKLEIEKLKRETHKEPELGQKLRNQQHSLTFRIIAKRLESNSIKLEDLEIEVEESDGEKVKFT